MKFTITNIKQVQLLTSTILVVAATSLLLFGGSSIYNNKIYGHNFAGDESASFLALMDQIQTEMSLINTNLIDGNQSIAKDHLKQIKELYTKNIKKEIAERNERIANEISSIINETSIAIEKNNNNQDISESVKNFNDVLAEAISVRIDSDALTNATINALHFANLINSIDLSYANAIGTKPMNMSAMNMGNNSTISHGNNTSNNTMPNMKMNHGDSITSMSKHTDNNQNTTDNITISNMASYQTANELTNDAIELFNSTIKQNIPSNATENSKAIESGLQQLKNMIESKVSYNKIMGIIHGTIQTNTLEVFNLPLKTSK
ncbi:MAG TPA: hypothetical protein VEW92_05170 [Nitrososphaeraceae archaeon]|nr:hypothetical protein [Nitrososphaeraceae archaeon]